MNQFLTDVKEGLSAQPKRLPSKYFYDKIGDALFVKIMHCKEYYLTRCEYEIFKNQSKEIINACNIENIEFDLIELGAGDGTKTLEILQVLDPKNFIYKPIDISENALNGLKNRFAQVLPNVKVEPVKAEYFEALKSIKKGKRKLVFFLGSNLGNLTDNRAQIFLKNLSEQLEIGDMLLLGLDLKKSPEIIRAAYNDKNGYTRQFNLNLLARINKELSGDFVLENWEHVPNYDEKTGVAESFLQSKTDQNVFIEAIGQSFTFLKNELIHTEISRKYDEHVIQSILANSGFEVVKYFFDSKHFFTDLLLEKKI